MKTIRSTMIMLLMTWAQIDEAFSQDDPGKLPCESIPGEAIVLNLKDTAFAPQDAAPLMPIQLHDRARAKDLSIPVQLAHSQKHVTIVPGPIKDNKDIEETVNAEWDNMMAIGIVGHIGGILSDAMEHVHRKSVFTTALKFVTQLPGFATDFYNGMMGNASITKKRVASTVYRLSIEPRTCLKLADAALINYGYAKMLKSWNASKPLPGSSIEEIKSKIADVEGDLKVHLFNHGRLLNDDDPKRRLWEKQVDDAMASDYRIFYQEENGVAIPYVSVRLIFENRGLTPAMYLTVNAGVNHKHWVAAPIMTATIGALGSTSGQITLDKGNSIAGGPQVFKGFQLTIKGTPDVEPGSYLVFDMKYFFNAASQATNPGNPDLQTIADGPLAAVLKAHRSYPFVDVTKLQTLVEKGQLASASDWEGAKLSEAAVYGYFTFLSSRRDLASSNPEGDIFPRICADADDLPNSPYRLELASNVPTQCQQKGGLSVCSNANCKNFPAFFNTTISDFILGRNTSSTDQSYTFDIIKMVGTTLLSVFDNVLVYKEAQKISDAYSEPGDFPRGMEQHAYQVSSSAAAELANLYLAYLYCFNINHQIKSEHGWSSKMDLDLDEHVSISKDPVYGYSQRAPKYEIRRSGRVLLGFTEAGLYVGGGDPDSYPGWHKVFSFPWYIGPRATDVMNEATRGTLEGPKNFCQRFLFATGIVPVPDPPSFDDIFQIEARVQENSLPLHPGRAGVKLLYREGLMAMSGKEPPSDQITAGEKDAACRWDDIRKVCAGSLTRKVARNGFTENNAQFWNIVKKILELDSGYRNATYRDFPEAIDKMLIDTKKRAGTPYYPFYRLVDRVIYEWFNLLDTRTALAKSPNSLTHEQARDFCQGGEEGYLGYKMISFAEFDRYVDGKDRFIEDNQWYWTATGCNVDWYSDRKRFTTLHMPIENYPFVVTGYNPYKNTRPENYSVKLDPIKTIFDNVDHMLKCRWGNNEVECTCEKVCLKAQALCVRGEYFSTTAPENRSAYRVFKTHIDKLDAAIIHQAIKSGAR